MIPENLNIAYAVLAGAFASYLLNLWITRRTALPLPPGPRGYPLIGNLYDVPHAYLWIEYAGWAKTYGDVISYTIFGNTTVVLNSLDAVVELLEKRSANYSDRPRMVMASDLMGWEWDFAHMHYTDRWRRHRRMFHQYFQPRNMEYYYPSQKKALYVLLSQLLRSPETFHAHVRQFVGAVSLKAAYGYEVQAENDPYVKLAHDAIQPLLEVVHASGNYLVEFIPWLMYVPAWMPGAGFKRKARVSAKTARALRDVPFNNVKKSIADGSAQPSFVYDNLEKSRTNDPDNYQEQEEITKNCAGMVYLAGSDTTASLIVAWMLAMVLYPEVQRRGQMELKKVLGTSGLPDFSDRAALPYVEAMLLETMRWFTITPLAVPHRTLKEDVYNGYRIPAGATITANAWSILHNEKLYKDPFSFKPDRFIKDGAISFDSEPDPLLVGGFGYGRRICPGRHLALNTAWIAIASIMANFDITKAVDENGVVIEPVVEASDGLVSHPKPFKVLFVPRHPGVMEVIESSKREGDVTA